MNGSHVCQWAVTHWTYTGYVILEMSPTALTACLYRDTWNECPWWRVPDVWHDYTRWVDGLRLGNTLFMKKRQRFWHSLCFINEFESGVKLLTNDKHLTYYRGCSRNLTLINGNEIFCSRKIDARPRSNILNKNKTRSLTKIFDSSFRLPHRQPSTGSINEI